MNFLCNFWFNKKWEHPLEMFSWQHIVALSVVLAIFLIVFFSRKFFMKNKVADIIFRYTLGIGLIMFELVLQLHNGASPLFGRVMADTYPLCGYMIWFCAIGLMANSSRLIKLIYPLAITGGSLSLIVIDMTCTFPHFGAFQFWFVHAGFMLGVLYFMFTKKITRYTIKDLGRSMVFLLVVSCYVLLIASGKLMLNSKFTDPLFILAPPGGLEFIKDALGQVGYTIIYILLIVAILCAIYGITYLCTKHRKIEETHEFPFKENKILNKICKIKTNIRYLILLIVFAFGLYSSVLFRSTSSTPFVILDEIFFLSLIILTVINEMTNLYLKRKETLEKIEIKSEEKTEELDKI